MPRIGATVKRRACMVGLVSLALLGSMFVASHASNARRESGPNPFQASIKIKKTKLYCSGKDDRVYLKTYGIYGQPKKRFGLAYRAVRTQVKVRVLKRRGRRRVIASSIQNADIELKGGGRKISHRHTIRFSRKRSKRILRYAYGSASCKHRKSKRMPVKLYVTERLISSSSSSSTSNKRRIQRKRLSFERRVHYRSCVPYKASGCSEPPAQSGDQETEHAETQPENAETSQGPDDPPSCIPADRLETQPVSSSANYSQRYQIGSVESGEIDEASGLASSRKNSGVLWLHNDSGDSARLFAINTRGQLLGTYTISGASAHDWEDLAIGPGPEPGVDYLYIADIGDNSAVRSSVTLYLVPEPSVSNSQPGQDTRLSVSDSIQITYPDGPRDAETLMVDPQDGDVYIMSKRELLSHIYRLPSEQWAHSSAALDYIGTLSLGGAVGGDISPGGNEMLIKSYWAVYHYKRQEGSDVSDALSGDPTALFYTAEPQGEAIAFCGWGPGYFTLSEGHSQPLYYYN